MSPQFVTSYLSSLGGVTNAKSNVVVSSDSFSVTSMAFSEVSKSFIVPLKNRSSPVVSKQPPLTFWFWDGICNGVKLRLPELRTRCPARLKYKRRLAPQASVRTRARMPTDQDESAQRASRRQGGRTVDEGGEAVELGAFSFRASPSLG